MRPESADGTNSCGSAWNEPSSPHSRFAVRQISGMLARRIVCTLQLGQSVTRGEKFGMIKLGSRTELILPADAVEITVKVGDKIQRRQPISWPVGSKSA